MPGQAQNDECGRIPTHLAETRGRDEKELELMDGSDQAVALADQAVHTKTTTSSDFIEPIEKAFLIYICSAILTKSGRKPIDGYNFISMNAVARQLNERP